MIDREQIENWPMAEDEAEPVKAGPEHCDLCRYSESVCGPCYAILFGGEP